MGVPTRSPAAPPDRDGAGADLGSGAGAGGALAAYQALVADWQRSRSTFFTAVSDGRSRPVGQQRALAAAHLAGAAPVAAGVRAAAPSWPAPARTRRAAARRQLRQQAILAAMARAAGPAAFTAGLADYGVGVAAEEQAIRAVERALTR